MTHGNKLFSPHALAHAGSLPRVRGWLPAVIAVLLLAGCSSEPTGSYLDAPAIAIEVPVAPVPVPNPVRTNPEPNTQVVQKPNPAGPPAPAGLPPGVNAEFPNAQPRTGSPPPAPPVQSRPPIPATVPGLRIGSVDYVDAAAFFGRYGLSTTMAAGNLRYTLQGGGSRLEIQGSEREMTLNGLRVFLGEPVMVRARVPYVSRNDAERLLGPIIAPAQVSTPLARPHVIMLDPGHGGIDAGTSNANLAVFEKACALDVALRLKPLLEAAGWQVVMTRTDDHFIPLPQRPALANQAKADLFVSIHFNSVPGDTRPTGTEVYTFPPETVRSTRSWSAGGKDDSEAKADPSNRFDAWSAVLANALHGALLAKLGTLDRGQKMAHDAVLRGLNCPGVLVESAFLSNDAEARRVATPAYRQQIAEAIAAGLANYSAQVAPARK